MVLGVSYALKISECLQLSHCNLWMISSQIRRGLTRIVNPCLQVRATLLGSQAGRTVCRDRLLDLFVAINRLRSPDGNGYFMDSVDDCNNGGNSVNVRLLRPMDFKPKLEEENNPNSDVLVEEENISAIGKYTASAQEGFFTRPRVSQENTFF